MGQQWTASDVREAHRSYIAAGVLLGVMGVWLDWWPPLAGFTSLQAAGKTGCVLAIVLIGGAVTHRRWYFTPARVFRRALGGPDGWLDRNDLDYSAGEVGVRRTGHPGQAPDPGAPVTAYGWRVGHLISGPWWLRWDCQPRSWAPGRWCRNWLPRRRGVYSPWARGFGLVGPQGSGKTQFLVHPLLDSPGAVVAPSTKPELVVLTRALRERVGPTRVFNPSLLGQIGSDFCWDPISGCTDQGIADRRAWALVRGAGGAAGVERPDFWAGKAQEIVRCYLLAAALAGLDMTRVMWWANDPDDPEPVDILAAHGWGAVPPGWLEMLRSHLGAPVNTRGGYFATVVSCVGFVDTPSVAAACRPGPGGAFNVATFLRERGTLYLVGGSGDRRLAPLLTALTEYVFDEAQRIAATSPGGRLAPTLNFILDEVANITPVPLDRWASDSRGWGITVGAVVQSLAQFETTWGRARAEVIWDNLPCKVVLPGVTNPEDLRALSYLSGARWVQRITRGESHTDRPDQDGLAWLGVSGRSKSSSVSRTPTQEPVIEGYTIAGMPPWHAFVLGLAPRPAIVGYEPGYVRVAREHRALPPAPAPLRVPEAQRAAGGGKVLALPTLRRRPS